MSNKHKGFTLIELMTAVAILAVIAVISWQGLDQILRTQQQTRAFSDDVLALQAGLDQWRDDLEALQELPHFPALDWDGRILRMTRKGQASNPSSTLVVAWTTRLEGDKGSQWLRWQSTPLKTQSDWQTAWQQAAQWGQNPTSQSKERQIAISFVSEWQIFYFRENAWTHPQSSSANNENNSSNGSTANQLGNGIPDGVRLMLDLPQGHPLSGRISKDWVRPTLTNSRS